MSKFDFETVLNRESNQFIAVDMMPTGAETYKSNKDKIPLWVADMSFPTAPSVLQSIKDRMVMPNLGYFYLSDEYYNRIIWWHNMRKPLSGLSKEMIHYENGVLGGVSSAIQAFTSPGEKIFFHAPTYVGFLHVLESIGRIPCVSNLILDENNVWQIDFDNMEKTLKDNNIHFAVFCSPHNPCGRAWTENEIEKCMSLFKKYNCVVISDEIWSDIVLFGNKHIPTQSVNEDARNRTIAFYSPSKTFSLAGLVGSYSVIPNTYLQDRLIRHGNMSHYNTQNTLSTAALLGAYSNEGSEWCDEMILQIEKNIEFAISFIESDLKGVRVMKPQGTYMLFIDCSNYLKMNEMPFDQLYKRGIQNGVIWQCGDDFLWKNSIRLNLALPFSLCKEAFERMQNYVFI